MLVEKEIIRPGTYWYTDQQTQTPRKLVVTPDGIKHFHESGNKMLQAGLSVPVPLEHQPEARPLTAAERAAANLLNNAGWVAGYKVTPENVLMGVLDIEDPQVAKKLPSTIRWTSPWISSFTDGNGQNWDGVISHVALTTRPRIVNQAPFPSVAAAMSLAGELRDVTLSDLRERRACGLLVSRAGLLAHGESGALKPMYPMAFSLYSGVPLAEYAVDPKEKAAVKKPPVEEKSATNGEKPTEKPSEHLEMMPEESLIDADGDISVYDVICDLLCSEGYEVPEGTTKDNFAERLYTVLMDKMKNKGAEAKMADQPTNQPPVGPKNDLPRNPVVQEQPPLYMSLEQIATIQDPMTKSIALSLHAQQERSARLERNAIAQARAKRDTRVARLVRGLPQNRRDQLVQMAQNAKFSLAEDGTVSDELAVVLDIMEAGLRNMPEMLTTPAGQLIPVAHPQDFGPEIPMSEERRSQVVDEWCKNTHLKKPPGQE